MKNANVILITVDCLRANHLSLNGYSKKTSPYLDKIAENGLNFQNAIATGCWTGPSFTYIFTSSPFEQSQGENPNEALFINGKTAFISERLDLPHILYEGGVQT